MKKIKTFYTPKQVCHKMDASFSKSPLKPYLLMKKIQEEGYGDYFDIEDNFEPIKKEDFLIAHTEQYVNDVFNKTGWYNTNGLPWSKELVKSLHYTTGSLLAAKRWAIEHPEQLCFAPISGMHHARPKSGSGYCTFSGQVISAIKIYEEYGLSGAYLDLDNHYGNSIEDTYEFNPKLKLAIPVGYNINPSGYNESYIQNFKDKLELLKKQIIAGKIHYVVFAHGADSHNEDDLGGKADTYHWIHAAEVFAKWVNEVSQELGKPLPVVMCLFGGYRQNDYDFVLKLHISSLLTCSKIIYDQEVNLEVKEELLTM